MNIKKRWLLTMGIAACLNGSGYARAEALPEFTLDSIVVVDSRTGDNREQTETVSINVKEKINAGQIQTVADILQDIPGIIVQRGQNSGIWVSMRGLNHERTLVAINGNVVENIGEIKYARALEWDAIPVNNVKRIEIIRGAGSAVYGGAVGGIINIITEDSSGEAKTTLRQSYGSWNTRKTTLSNQGTQGNLSWGINAGRQESDGYYRNNYSDGDDVNLNLTYRLTPEKVLTFLYSKVDKKEGIIIGNNRGSSPASSYLGYDDSYPETGNAPNNWVGGYRHWNTDNATLNYTTATSRLGLYKYRQDRQEFVERVTGMGPGRKFFPLTMDWDSRIDNSGINWQKTLARGNHGLTYGAQYKKMDFTIYSQNSVYKLPAYSAFFQDDWRIDELTAVGLALRYDHHEFTAGQGGVSSAVYSQLTPKINITRKLQEGSYLYAGAGRFFRAPTVADYSRWNTGYEDATGAYRGAYFGGAGADLNAWRQFLGVPSPEKGMSYELGWRKSLSANAGIRLTGFYNDIDNYLNLGFGHDGTLLPPVVYNVDNVKVKGVELSGDYRLNPHWALVAGYTRQSADKRGDRMNAPLKALPGDTFTLGTRYSNLRGFQAALDLRYMGETDASSEAKGINSYTVADLSCSYTRQGHTVNLAVNNLFDRSYEVNAGYRMPGINYSVSYQYAF